jgi:hypothetical protein
MLGQGMPNKTFLRRLGSAFGYVINNRNEKYHSPLVIRDEIYIDLRHAFVPEQRQQQEIDPTPSIGMGLHNPRVYPK